MATIQTTNFSNKLANAIVHGFHREKEPSNSICIDVSSEEVKKKTQILADLGWKYESFSSHAEAEQWERFRMF